jgi:DNA-binding transcriptional regulator YdaS (Cro superfamily)
MSVSKFKMILDNAGISQKHIAQSLGVSRWAIRYWYTHPQAIKAKYIPAISSITNVNENELYNLINTHHGIPTETE